MARSYLRVAVLAVACAFALPADAQNLQRLTVQSFELSADNAHPALEVPFHLIIRVKFRERIASFEDIQLPILAEFGLQGDERRIDNAGSGTQYVETVGVVAHHTGDITIPPATLQAIDPRDGKAKQYFSNPLTIHVGGGDLEPLATAGDVGAHILRLAITIIVWIAGAACAVVLLVLLFRRRPPVQQLPPPVAVAPPPRQARSRRDVLADALAVLRAERSRASAVNVRRALWAMVGASEGETLADVLNRSQNSDVRFADVLAALERAAFTYDADLATAIEHACDRLERCLA